MLRVWVYVVVSFTAVTIAHIVRQDVTSEDSMTDGRFKRQATEPTEMDATDDNKPHPRPRNRFQKHLCCKEMPMIFEWNIMKGCMSPRGHRHGPPGPPGRPPPHGGPPPHDGPPPSEGDPDGPDNDASSDYGIQESDADSTVVTPKTTNSASSEKNKQGDKGPRASQGRGPGRSQFRENFTCAVECAFGKINAIKDGTVDQKALEDYIEYKFKYNPEDPWKNIALDALKSCSSVDINQDQKCKTGAAEVMKCMYKQMFRNCPETNWQSTEECHACRDSEDKCSFNRGGKWKGNGRKE